MPKEAHILQALHNGASRNAVSVALFRLADIGRIERAGVANVRRAGRPCLRWRVRD